MNLCKVPNYYQTLYHERYNLCNSFEETAVALRNKKYSETSDTFRRYKEFTGYKQAYLSGDPSNFSKTAGKYDSRYQMENIKKGMTPALS